MKFCRNKLVPEYITGKQELSKEDVVRLLQESEIFSPKYETNEDYFYGKHKILNRHFDDPSTCVVSLWDKLNKKIYIISEYYQRAATYEEVCCCIKAWTGWYKVNV